MKFRQATESDEKSWDTFAKANGGSVYDLFSWSRIFQISLGYKSEYLIGEESQSVKAIFPIVRRGKFKTSLSSLPFTDCAGPIAQNESVFQPCLKYLTDQSIPYEVYSTFRDKKNSGIEIYSLFELDLTQKYSEIFAQRYHHKTRNMVRKAEKNALTITVVKPTTLGEVKDFYSLYTKTMKKLGTISLPFVFFSEISKVLNEHSILIKVECQKTIVSLLWCFEFGESLYIWANGSDEHLLNTGANYAAYDQAVKFAIETKKRKLILGASDNNSPQAFFKGRWGARAIPVYCYTNNNIDDRKKSLKLIKSLLKICPMSIYLLICKTIFAIF